MKGTNLAISKFTISLSKSAASFVIESGMACSAAATIFPASVSVLQLAL